MCIYGWFFGILRVRRVFLTEKLKVIYDWNFEDMGGDGGVLEGVEKSGKYK